ncbi:hypothetical protein BU16DRAFT_539159 [Lophium mytilinum]|uniref:Actin-like ATPase domain-containing protein n=1 Tax=Lophium mytilinum TaxID=390894 RepID=A0A6A6QSS7_9PEZI|nr:hypothetical protein BU16DRAFT_539159 [Lophium mytilinum]
MSSRSATSPISPNRTKPPAPITKQKPASLRGSPVSPRSEQTEPDYLNDDLLEEDFDEASTPSYKYQDQSGLSETDFDDAPLGRLNTNFDEATLRRLVIAIDFGTTFTGVAFALPKSDEAGLNEIKVIDNWGARMSNSLKVPSIYSYSPAPNGQQQWGDDLSPDAVTMINTKLELDVQDNKSDELELILQVLDGMKDLSFNYVRASGGYPEYTWKSPDEIVTDYLTKVYQALESNLKTQIRDQGIRQRLTVDIVVTVPVDWAYRAKNSTLRAIRNAGFNEQNFPKLQDIIMVTEPEAAAMYTARYLKTKMQKDFLKIGECFVLCDAGGGTVDVVSYRVTNLEPTLELELTGIPYSSKSGSAYIDTNFKLWLRDILGERYFQQLDQNNSRNRISTISEGRRMRFVIKQFDAHKKNFSLKSAPMKIELPEPLKNISIAGKVNLGELTITSEEMRSFFDPCVDGVIELYQGQLQQIERQGRRLKNVFLIGGFGESRYLEAELQAALKFRNVELRRPDTSWTAVVRGAVIHGIEKTNRVNVVYMKTCPRSYGIVLNETFRGSMFHLEDRYTDTVTGDVKAQGQITWLVKKGDLILSDEGRTSSKEFRVSFQGTVEAGERKKKLSIYEYEDDDLPDRFQNAREELKEVAVLTYDLSTISLDNFDRAENPTNKALYYETYLTCKMVMSGATVTVEILWNDTELCKVKIEDVGRKSSTRSWS